VGLSNERQQEIYEIILVHEHKIRQKALRAGSLNRSIEIVRILGSKVTELDAGKKQELAVQAKEYMALKKEIEDTKRERDLLLDEHRQLREYRRAICAKEEVLPPTTVHIDNRSLDVREARPRVIFYKRGIIIMGDLDKFRERAREG
jgi:hypothetical protein